MALPFKLEQIAETFWSSVLEARDLFSEDQVRTRVSSLLTLRWLNERFSGARLSLSSATRTAGSVYFREDPEEREALLEEARLYLSAGIPWVPPVSRWGHVQTRAHRRSPALVVFQALERIEHPDTRTARAEMCVLWRSAPASPKTIRDWLTKVDRLGLAEPTPTLEVLGHLLGMRTDTVAEEARTHAFTPPQVTPPAVGELNTQMREFETLLRRIRGQA